MVKGFKDFLLKNQVLGLAIAVIMGGAVGKVVSSIVADLLMPLISLVIPGGEWRSAKIVLGKITAADGKEVVNALNYGNFLGSVVDFAMIGFCVYIITKTLIKEAPAPPLPATKECPKCTEAIPVAAKKCKYCTSDVG